jgi:hypothetical protein
VSIPSGEKQSSDSPVEIGPPPYYHRSDCNICRKQDGLKTGSELLDVPRPGGYIVESEYFVVGHAPLQESSAGTVIVEARRHLLDFGTRDRVDQPDPLVIAQRRLAEPRAAGHLLDGQPCRMICGDGSHALILQNLKRFKSNVEGIFRVPSGWLRATPRTLLPSRRLGDQSQDQTWGQSRLVVNRLFP